MKSRAFKKCICGWLRFVHSCYLAQSRLIKKPFESVHGHNIVEVVSYSSEKDAYNISNTVDR